MYLTRPCGKFRSFKHNYLTFGKSEKGTKPSRKCENSAPKMFVFKFNSRSHGEKWQMHLFIFTLKNGVKKNGSRGGSRGFVTCIYFGHIMWLHRDRHGKCVRTYPCCGARNFLLAFAHKISTAATPFCSLSPPPAAVANVPKLSHTSMLFNLLRLRALPVVTKSQVLTPKYYIMLFPKCQELFRRNTK